MSSASQIDYATISEDQLAKMLSKVKSSRETEALRARLPAQLAPFASNITIVEPIQTVYTSLERGAFWGSCQVKERRIRMSVAVVPPPDSQSQTSEQPHTKPLELVWRDWETGTREMSGSADSQMHSISLRYGPPHHRGMHSKPSTAYIGWYDVIDSPVTYDFSYSGIISVVEEVIRDMGFREGELDNKLEVIDALLGDDGRELLESDVQDETTLRKIIEGEIDARR